MRTFSQVHADFFRRRPLATPFLDDYADTENAMNITSRNYMTLWGQIVLNFTGPSQTVIGETETAAPTKPPSPATSGER